MAYAFSEVAAQRANKPNILVIFGDDIGITNVSAYGGGLMGCEETLDDIKKAQKRATQKPE